MRPDSPSKAPASTCSRTPPTPTPSPSGTPPRAWRRAWRSPSTPWARATPRRRRHRRQLRRRLPAARGRRRDTDVVFRRYSPANALVGGRRQRLGRSGGRRIAPAVDVSGTGQFVVGWVQGEADGARPDRASAPSKHATPTPLTPTTRSSRTWRWAPTTVRHHLPRQPARPRRLPRRERPGRRAAFVLPAVPHAQPRQRRRHAHHRRRGVATSIVRLNGTTTTYGTRRVHAVRHQRRRRAGLHPHPQRLPARRT
jgi:hypothetical protein